MLVLPKRNVSLYARNLFFRIRNKASLVLKTKKNTTQQPSVADSIILNCLIHGETPPFNCVFTVEIAKSKTVDSLKDVIKEKQQPTFNHIRAGQLSLWKVSLPFDSNLDKVLKQLVLDDDATKGVQSLFPADKLSNYFTDEPAEKHLHVIAKPPSVAVVPSKRERDQESEALQVPSKRGERGQESKAPQKVQKILGARSVSKTRIFETIEKSWTGLALTQELMLPCVPNFTYFRTTAGMIFADKTMYIEHLEKRRPYYRCMFLRPRRFGKSSFLNMLCDYYDIHKADVFNDLFGPLYIGKNPTPWCNQHLVLKFDLSCIDVSGSRDEMKTSFNKEINGILWHFIRKYDKELGYPEVNNILDTSDASASLNCVLGLVGESGHTLFVGVDEYDAPANNSTFKGTNTGLDKSTIDKVAEVEQFFNQSFFALLKRGCGRLYNDSVVISKYFLTGVTPAFRAGISPLAEADLVSDEVDLHGICGFTENEVKTIVQHYLSKNEQEAEPIIHIMRKLYNGYFFANTRYDESDPKPPLLYNPHLVFHYIRKFSSHGMVTKPEESTAVHSTTILKSISDIGEFSVNDLEDLIINGSVSSKIKTEFGFSDLLSVGKDRIITWSLLYYFGILTVNSNGNLRIPNDVIKLDVLERITSYLRAQDKIRTLIGPAIRSLCLGETEGFITLLQTFLETRSVRSQANANEYVLQGIVEVLLDEPNSRVPELRLVLDGTKKHGDGRFGFVDIFIHSIPMFQRTCVILELKNIMLEGLLIGEINDWNKQPNFSDLEKLQNKLKGEDDKSLLARKYMYWSKEQHKPVLTTVSNIMANAKEQLEKYMQTIGKGNSKSYRDSGVLDSRVEIKEGYDKLQGYVIIAIGGRRILMHSTELMSTSNEYQKALHL